MDGREFFGRIMDLMQPESDGTPGMDAQSLISLIKQNPSAAAEAMRTMLKMTDVDRGMFQLCDLVAQVYQMVTKDNSLVVAVSRKAKASNHQLKSLKIRSK